MLYIEVQIHMLQFDCLASQLFMIKDKGSHIDSERREVNKQSVNSRKMSEGSSIVFEEESVLRNQSYEFLYQEPEKPPKVVGGVKKCCKFCSCLSSQLTMLLNFQSINFYTDSNFTNLASSIPLKNIRSVCSYRKRDTYFIRIITKDHRNTELRLLSKRECREWITHFNTAIQFQEYLREKEKYYRKDKFNEYLKTLSQSKNDTIIRMDDSTVAISHGNDSSFLENDTVINKKTDSVHLRDFVITHQIGRGAFSTVYKAEKDGLLYALKQTNKDELLYRDQLKCSITELNILKRCQSCPFIIPLHYAFQTEDYLYLALKYLPFGTLLDRISADKVLSYAEAFRILCQLVAVIQFLHEKNILYRDLKPENILMTAEDNIMLIDFGLGIELSYKEQFAHTFVGTPMYLVPERLLNDGRVNYKADIYGVGCIFYQMLHGKVPFEGDSLPSIMLSIKHTEIEIDPSLDEMAQAFLRETLQKNAQKRLGHMSSHPLFENVNWKKILNKRINRDKPTNAKIISQQISIKGLNDVDYTQQTYPNKKVNDWNFTIKI